MASPYVHPTTITWRAYPGASTTNTRRAWLVRVPHHTPLVVVTETAEDPGQSIQNGAEAIAASIAQDFPGHVVVLHYPAGRTALDPTAPSGWFMPIPQEGGTYVFGRTLTDLPDVAAALAAAGLHSPPAPQP